MYKLNVFGTFSSAHRLEGYNGLCQNLHGHNWKVRLTVLCDTLDPLGMALDFGVLKGSLNELLSEFDHQYLNDLPAFAGLNPTSEHIARHIFEGMTQRLSDCACEVAEVEVWESDKASVVFGL